MNVKEEVTEAVLQNVSKCFNKDIGDLNLDTRLIEDLNAKSVNFIQVSSFLEEQFGLTISYMDLRRQNTISAIIDYLVKRV
jgi:acyl carrier protein